MIPRTKVNYTLANLSRALFVRERPSNYKSELVLWLRRYFERDNILLTPSGRGGMYFILRALLQPKVLVPAYTCAAVVEAAQLAGKEVVFVECERDGFNMCVQALAQVIDADSVVIATHQFGIPCEIESIKTMCEKHGAILVEDAAASFGTRANGTLTGVFGDVAFFSFDSAKVINVPVKGGFVLAKDPRIFQRIEEVYLAEIRSASVLKKIEWILKAAILLGYCLGQSIMRLSGKRAWGDYQAIYVRT